MSCNCESCQFLAKVATVKAKLNDEDRAIIEELIGKMIHEADDAGYWQLKHDAARAAAFESAAIIARGPIAELGGVASEHGGVIAATILASKDAAQQPGAAQGESEAARIEKAVVNEREACARIAEAPFNGQAHTELSRGKMDAANTIARNIRARSAVARLVGGEKGENQ